VRLAALFGCLWTTASAAQAADASRFTFTPYLWAASIGGQVGALGQAADVSVGFGDIVSQVDFGAMGLFEARFDRWLGRLDLFYVSITDEQPLTTRGAATLRVTQRQLMLQPEVGYGLLVAPWGGVDLLAGARYWHLDLDFHLGGPGASKDWVDATGGLAFRFRPGGRWRFGAKADAGGGGSQFTWQALGSVGYDLGRCCTVQSAYRYLNVDNESGTFLYDVHLDGPALGLTLRF
jgi:hypothetical protein